LFWPWAYVVLIFLFAIKKTIPDWQRAAAWCSLIVATLLPYVFVTYTDNVPSRQVYLAIGSGVDAADAQTAIDGVLEQWPNADLLDQAQFKQSVTEEIDQILNLIYGLLALAVVIALIGVANTLALSVHERTREIGLLRAVGMTRSQVKASVRWESVMIALLGTSTPQFSILPSASRYSTAHLTWTEGFLGTSVADFVGSNGMPAESCEPVTEMSSGKKNVALSSVRVGSPICIAR